MASNIIGTIKLNDDITLIEFNSGANFSYPMTYEYQVLQTGERFSGRSGYALEDYLDWKPEERGKFPAYCNSQKIFHIEPFATVIQTPYVNYPFHFRYKLIQTGERFTGETGDPSIDYFKYKEEKIKNSNDMFKLSRLG